MALEYVSVAPATLGSSIGTLHTVPQGHGTARMEIIICNTDSTSSHTAEIYLVPVGGSAEAANQVLKTTMVSGETMVFSFMVVLNAGDTVQGKATDGGVVSIRISSVDRT